MRTWWTAEKIAALVDEFRAGKTYREIAQALGSTPGSVGQQVSKLRAAGVELPWRGGNVDVEALNNRVPVDQRVRELP